MRYAYTFPLSFGFLSHLVDHRALSRAPCVYSTFSLVIYFIHSIASVYPNILDSVYPSLQIHPTFPSSLVFIRLFSKSVFLFLFFN